MLLRISVGQDVHFAEEILETILAEITIVMLKNEKLILNVVRIDYIQVLFVIEQSFSKTEESLITGYLPSILKHTISSVRRQDSDLEDNQQ